MKISPILFASSALAGPILENRYDLDHDGITDWCHSKADVVSCLLHESSYVWTTFTASLTSTTAVAKTIPTLTSISPSITTSAASNPTNPTNTASSSTPSFSTGTLPDIKNWKTDNGTKWHVSKVGSIYSSTVPSLGWDNGRTSTLGNKSFWIFGDVLSFNGLQNGLSTGPSFYVTQDEMLRVDMGHITNVNNILLAPPAPSDPAPEDPWPLWGLSTGNVAEVSPGIGIGFVWEIWRNSSGTGPDRGLGMYQATLGPERPLGNRTGPLIAGPDALPVGIMTIMVAEGYVYTYTNKDTNKDGSGGIIVGRASVAKAFDPKAYEFLHLDGTWVPGIPSYADAKSNYGVAGDVKPISQGQGSAMWSNYFQKYLLFTGQYASSMMFYASETPYGPFSGPYNIETVLGYGVNVHPFWSPDGSHQTLYLSSGWNNTINMYKLEFDY